MVGWLFAWGALFGGALIWAQVARLRFHRWYWREQGAMRSWWEVYRESRYEWGILFARQGDPEIERLRLRTLVRFGVALVIGASSGALFLPHLWW